MGDPIKPNRGVLLGRAIAWWQIQITVMLQFRCHANHRVIPHFHKNHVGKLQDNALSKGTTLPFALTNSKETL
jgi:hypothetical protein